MDVADAGIINTAAHLGRARDVAANLGAAGVAVDAAALQAEVQAGLLDIFGQDENEDTGGGGGGGGGYGGGGMGGPGLDVNGETEEEHEQRLMVDSINASINGMFDEEGVDKRSWKEQREDQLNSFNDNFLNKGGDRRSSSGLGLLLLLPLSSCCCPRQCCRAMSFFVSLFLLSSCFLLCVFSANLCSFSTDDPDPFFSKNTKKQNGPPGKNNFHSSLSQALMRTVRRPRPSWPGSRSRRGGRLGSGRRTACSTRRTGSPPRSWRWR